MKLRVANFLALAVISVSWSMGLAQVPPSLRAREVKSESTILTGPCTLYKRITKYMDGPSKESWDCLLNEADGAGIYPVTEALNLTLAVSGETTLSGQDMALSANKTVIVDPTEAVFGGETSRRGRDRRLEPVTGDKKFVVVRVTCGTQVVTKSLEELKANVFSDAICLKSQMEACSNKAVTISEGYSNGGIEVTIASCADRYSNENAVTAAVTTLVKYNPISSMSGDYFMYVMPPGDNNIFSYSYVDARVSVYRDNQITYVSKQMLAIGMNFGLMGTYYDKTGFMSYDLWYSEDSYESMCYNAVDMYQLGWLKTVTTVTSQPASGTYTLVGHTNYGGGIQALRLEGTPNSGITTYIWFNHAFGINIDTQEGADRVFVITDPLTFTPRPPKDYMCPQSPTTQILDVGGSYSPSDELYQVRVISIKNGEAIITFDSFAPTAAPTPDPTAAPSPGPTAVPTSGPTAAPTPDPTAAPTPDPTAVPTQGPTAVPTSGPTAAPTPDPTAGPTPDPTAAPTPDPTAAPTQDPTAVPTQGPTVAPTPDPTAAPVPDPTAAPVPDPTAAPVPDPTAAPVSVRIVCPKTKKRKKCPPGCIFSKKKCLAPL